MRLTSPKLCECDQSGPLDHSKPSRLQEVLNKETVSIGEYREIVVRDFEGWYHGGRMVSRPPPQPVGRASYWASI